jgi:hypothetical protein
MVSRLLKPLRGPGRIGRNAAPHPKGHAQRKFGIGISLGRRFLEPDESRGIILRGSLSIEKANGKTELGGGKALLRRAAKTEKRLVKLMLAEIGNAQICEPALIHGRARHRRRRGIRRQRYEDRWWSFRRLGLGALGLRRRGDRHCRCQRHRRLGDRFGPNRHGCEGDGIFACGRFCPAFVPDQRWWRRWFLHPGLLLAIGTLHAALGPTGELNDIELDAFAAMVAEPYHKPWFQWKIVRHGRVPDHPAIWPRVTPS